MKKIYLLFSLVLLFICPELSAQIGVTVTNNTNTTPNLAVSYTSLANALTALNAVTAMSGPVTLTLTAGASETAPTTGLTIGSASLNAVLTATKTITIIKAAGAPTTLNSGTGGTGTPATAVQDGILNIVGADYVTINGLSLVDVNSFGPASMEYGIGLFKLSATDGANFNTIINCSILLNKENNVAGAGPSAAGSRGINVVNALVTAQTTNLTVTNATGANSGNKFYTNTIENCNIGIFLFGYADASPYTNADQNNDIGGSSAGTGNSILNFGGAAGATNAAAAVQTLAQYGVNVSYNKINNNDGSGANHTTTIRAIYLNTATGASATASNNNISIKAGGTTTSLYIIENQSGGTGSGNTVNISGNVFENCSFTNQTSGVFRAIYNGATVSNLVISSNTFNTVTFNATAGTGAVYFIYQGATIGTLTDINSNFFLDQAINTTGDVYLIYDSNNSPNISITNNSTAGTISKTAAGGTFYCYYNNGSPAFGTATLSFNTFSNIVLTGATSFYAIRLTTLQAQIEVISSNFITSITAGVNIAVGIFFDYGAVGSEVSGNYVQSIAGGSTVTGIQLGSFTPSLGLNAYGNIVGSLSSAGASPVTGILHSVGAATNIYKNKVYDLSSSHALGTVTGISMAGGTTVNINNNLVGDLRNSVAGTTNALVGIGIAGGTTANIYYNSVYLNGTSISGTFGTSALSITSGGAIVNLRNNILVNLSAAVGAGLTVASRRSTTALTTYGATSNNNLLYAGVPSASNLIFYDGTNSDQTLAAYKTRVSPRDGASVTENPPFISVNGLNDLFLHIQTGVPTQVESGGANISSYTDDFDYDIRQGNAGYAGAGSAPDIGADEGNFVLLDLAPPVISSLVSTSASCGTGTRTFTAILTDATGIDNTAGLRPRIYYNKNGGPWTSTQAVLTSGSVTNGTWTFTVDYTLVGGVAALDLINYFIVVQDAAPAGNKAATTPSAGLVFTNVNTITTFPTTFLTYTLPGVSLSGTYNVGTGQTYTTLTAAVAAYNTACLTGPVVFLLKDALYNGLETFPIVINANADANSTNTLTIKPDAGVTATVTGSSASSILQFNGADYITIDGSNNGTSSRNLTISNSNTGTSSLVVWLNSTAALDAATRNTVKNTIITGNAPTTTFFGIYMGGSTLPTFAEAANHSNTFSNNAVSAVSYGIGAGGATGNDSSVVITNNSLTNIGFRGIYAANQKNIVISNNTIQGLSSTNASSFNPSSGIIIEAEIDSANISRNIVSNIKNTGSFASYGITLQSSSSNARLALNNNFLYDIASNGDAFTLDNNGYGIAVTAGGGYKIYYNSISMNTNQVTAGVSAALYLRSGLASSSLDIRNNIFVNSQTTGSTYAMYSRSGNGTFTDINNNDYWNATGGNVGFLSSNRATIAAWRTATGKDLNSVSVNPNFISAVNLHINTAVTATVDGLAAVIPSVTVDYDLDARDAATPDMGADEFTPPPCAGAVGGTAADNGNGAFCLSGTPTITASGYSGGPGSGYQWQSSTTVGFGTPVDIAGQTNPASLAVGAIIATTYYRLKVTCTSGAAIAFSNIITITINNPTVSSPVNGTRCGTGTVNLSATPSAGASLDWYAALSGGLSLYTGNTFTTPVISANTTYYVAASIGGATEPAGKLVPSGTDARNFTDAGIVFNTTQNTSIVSSVVYPNGTGTITFALQNAAGTELAATGAIALSGSGISTPVTVPLGFTVPVGTGYRLIIKALTGFTGFSDGLIRDASGNTYPYTSASGALSVTGGWLSGTITNYYYFFNMVISTACSSSPRVAVTATVTAATAVSASAAPPAICEGSSTTLTATSANLGYVYTWTPGPVVGNSISVSPIAATTYTVNALDGGGCAASATVTVNVNARPSAVIVNPNPATICGAGSVQLDASGGIAAAVANANSGAISIVIPDNSATGISNSLAIASIPVGATIDSIIVSFDITQTFVGDQILHLQAPNGQIINLVSGQSLGSLDNFTNTRITSDNTFPNISTGTQPYTGTFKADAALSFGLTPSVLPTTTNFSALFTAPYNGNWTLWAFDDAGGDIGTLNNWTIKIAYKSPATFSWSPAANLNTTVGTQVFASPPSTTNYTATATNAAGCTNSMVVAVNVNNNPVSVSVVQSPLGAVCPNTPVQFTATGTNPGLTPNYRWLIDGVEPVATLTATAASVGTTVTVASTAGLMVGMRVTVTAGVGNFQIVPGPTRVASIVNATTFTVDQNPVSALGIGATISAVSNGTNVTSLTPANLAAGTYSITCVLTSNVSCPTGNPATSTPISLTVNPNTATSVSIAAVPSGAICAGTSVTFTATPTNGGAAPTYEWFIGAVSQGAASTLATTFTSAALANGNVITCRMVSNAPNCALPNPATSAGITMTVNSNLPVSVSIAAAPGVNICSGTSVTFTATPTNPGGSPVYNFKVNGISVQSGAGTTYTTTGLLDLDVVTCELTSSITPCATGNPATSNTLNISVTTQTASVTITPQTALCAGASRTYTANPTNQGATPTYEWFVNGTSVQGPNATATYTRSPSNGEIIRVDMVSSLSCALPIPATTSFVQVVNAVPAAAISGNTILCPGIPILLNSNGVAGSGSISGYQWKLGGVDIVGATAATYTATAIGTYSVVVTNSNTCSTTSANFVISAAATAMAGLSYTIGEITTTASGANAGATINVASTASLIAGQAVAVTSGTGAFASGTFTASLASAGTTINVVSTAGLIAGQLVMVSSSTAYGVFAAGTIVSSITNGTQFVVSTAPITALTAGATILAVSRVASIINGTQFVVDPAPSSGLLAGAVISAASCTNYISFATAIRDLNQRSVSGACLFTVEPNFVENINSQLALGNATLNAAVNAINTITFQKKVAAGSNPKINAAFVGTKLTTDVNPDGIWSLNGIDYVTIDGIDLNDNNSSSTTTTMEFGYGLFKSLTNPLSLTSGSSAGTTVTVASTAGLVVGSRVVVTAGTGLFAAGTTISSITNATQFVVSAVPTTALSGATVIALANPVTLAAGAGAGTSITVTSTAGLVVGSTAIVTAGTGVFPAGTIITSITNGTVFVVSAAPTTALSAATVTTGGGIPDGTQNNTIKNCAITLNRINNLAGTAPMVEGSVGILVINSTAGAATTALVPTLATGANSNNKFYFNTIQNCHHGIALSGYTAPLSATLNFPLGDKSNDIGGGSLATGNTIFNFGGTVAGSTQAAGIRINQQWDANVSYNTIANDSSATLPHPNTLRGIWAQAAQGASATINNNTITVKGGGAGGAQAVTGIDNGLGANVTAVNGSSVGTTITVTSTAGLEVGMTVIVTSGAATGVFAAGGSTILTIPNGTTFTVGLAPTTVLAAATIFGSKNTIAINNNRVTGTFTTATTGTWTGISTVANAGTININSNTVQNVALPGSGFLTAISNSATTANSPRVLTINTNIVQQMNKSAAVSATPYTLVTTGQMPSISSTATVNDNIINNNTIVASNTVAVTYNWIGYFGASTYVFNNNTITNNSVTGVNSTFVATVSGINNISVAISNESFTNNTINNLSIRGTGTAIHLLRGIVCPTNSTKTISGNIVNDLVTSGGISATVSGIQTSLGTVTLSKNYIYNLFPGQSAGIASVARGIAIVSGTTVTATNNVVALDFTAAPPVIAPAAANNVLTGSDAVRGIEVAGGTTINVWYNSVNLVGAGSGATFGSSAISLTAALATTTLDIRNNIFSNNMTPGGTLPGYTVAFRRSNTTVVYAAASNYNSFYAGTPSASRLLYYEVATPVSYQNIPAYSAGLSREANSNDLPTTFTSNINLIPTAANCANDGTGNNNGILLGTDYSGTLRSIVNPFTTDIGAYEFSSSSSSTLVINQPAGVCSPATVDLTAAAITSGSTATLFKVYSNAAGTTLYATPATAAAGTYYIRGYAGSCPSTPALSGGVLVSVGTPGTWLGVDNVWTNAANWCSGVPGAATDITIPTTGSGVYPVITAGVQPVRNIIISGSGSLTVSSGGTLQINGAITSVSNPIVANGTIEYKSVAAQTLNASHFSSSTIATLKVSNTQGTTGLSITPSMLNITTEVNFGAANNQKLTTSNLLTLKSTATATARIADVTNAATNTGNDVLGKVVIERYIPARRAWRLVTAPIKSSTLPTPTMFGNWQEGARSYPLGTLADPVPGFGTHISSGNNVPNFDQNYTNNPSIFYLTPTGWNGVPTNTSGTTIDSNNGVITDQPAYMLFVRGNRATNLALGTSAPTSVTTLRTTGDINVTFNAAFPLVITGKGAHISGPNTYYSFANPYPSAINFEKIISDALNAALPLTYYVWDANLTGSNGVGGWVTVSRSGPGVYATSPNTPSLTGGDIQSGMAFMVNAASLPSIRFKEAFKISGSNNLQYRPGRRSQLRTTLLAKNADGTSSVNDGTLISFDYRYSNKLDGDDAHKMPNFAENISLVSAGEELTIERRKPIAANDTIWFRMAKMKTKNYQLAFALEGVVVPAGSTAILEDLYLNSKTQLNMQDSSFYDFSVVANTASAASNRFRIVFKKLIKFSNINGYVVSSDIAVDWKLTTEFSINRYEIEKSADGTSFETVGGHPGSGNREEGRDYSWLDISPSPGEYYYRVKCIGANGAFDYTDKVKVTIMKSSPQIYVFPNPVTNNRIGVQMNRMPAGQYFASLMTEDGRVVYKSILIHAGGSAAEMIIPPSALPGGSYRLEITGPDKRKYVLKVIAKTG